MRDYGKVYTAFWTSEDTRSMSEDGRTLALYLLTCTHGNMLGCYRLTDAYAADDLKWTIERVSKGFKELLDKGFAYRCNRTFWLVIQHYLRWNQFENPNVGLAAGKLFDTLGAPVIVKALLAKALRLNCPRFPMKKLDDFEANLEPFDNPFETLSKTVVGAVAVTRAKPEPNLLVEQNQLDVVAQIFAYWQKIMSSPKSVLDTNRKGLITTALKSYSAQDICKAIRGCSKSPHNMGQNPQKTTYNGLGLILRNAEKIDRFIQLDDNQAVSASESLEDRNARIIAEVMRDVHDTDDNTIEMGA
jgi:hypothetical protein